MIKLNGNIIHVTMFPDNTSQVWKIPIDYFNRKEKLKIYEDDYHLIEWEYENEGEVMHLAQLKTLLDNVRRKNVKLYVPYLPYARQDKSISNNETFALQPFCEILNNMGFWSVTTLDVHSDVVNRHLKSHFTVQPINSIEKTIDAYRPTQICFPDMGALKRYINVVERLRLPFIVCRKNRNQETGEIINMELLGSSNNYKVLIVDDICDRGGTFMGAAKMLHDSGASSVALYTTHGIYSGGLKIIKDSGIERVFNRKGEISEDNQKNILVNTWE